jgi:hypothetical protein
MVREKFEAVAAARTAVALALAGGKSLEAATELVMVPVKRSVRANRLRLVRDWKGDGPLWTREKG